LATATSRRPSSTPTRPAGETPGCAARWMPRQSRRPPRHRPEGQLKPYGSRRLGRPRQHPGSPRPDRPPSPRRAGLPFRPRWLRRDPQSPVRPVPLTGSGLRWAGIEKSGHEPVLPANEGQPREPGARRHSSPRGTPRQAPEEWKVRLASPTDSRGALPPRYPPITFPIPATKSMRSLYQCRILSVRRLPVE
jgi:hypothetical protein